MEILLCPKRLLRKIEPRLEMQYQLDLTISAFVVLLVVPLFKRIPHFCLMQLLLGLPCPGCGILHSIEAAFKLKLALAWSANPAGLGVAVIVPWQLGTGFLGVCAPSLRKDALRSLRFGTKATSTALFAVWILRLFTHFRGSVSFLLACSLFSLDVSQLGARSAE